MNKQQEEFYQKLEELKAIYDAEMQKHSDALEEYQKEEEWPKDGDGVWYINAFGELSTTTWSRLSLCDKHLLKTGNTFRTKEDAEYHLRMIDLAWEIKNLSFEPDWAACYGVFKLCYDHKTINGKPVGVVPIFGKYVESHATYFKTKEIAEQAIELIKSSDDFLYMLRKGLI